MVVTPLSLASRYLGIQERGGSADHPLIQWWLSLCDGRGLDSPDEIPWCSAFVNGIHWELELPRTRTARARSWLGLGQWVDLPNAVPGDVIILRRGDSNAGPEVGNAPGHVGFYVSQDTPGMVCVLGGNQGNSVSKQLFDARRVLGVRRFVL